MFSVLALIINNDLHIRIVKTILFQLLLEMLRKNIQTATKRCIYVNNYTKEGRYQDFEPNKHLQKEN